jgi:WD40 repeat protein
VVPPRVIDARKANSLNALFIGDSGKIYTGGDDHCVRQWTVLGVDPASISTNVNETGEFETKTTINTIVKVPTTPALIMAGTAGGNIYVFNSSKEFTGKPQEAQVVHDNGASVDSIAFYQSPGATGTQTVLGGWRGMPEEPPIEPDLMDGNTDKNSLPPPGDNPGRINFYLSDMEAGTFELKHALMKNGLPWVNVLLFSADNAWLFSGGNDGSVTIWDPAAMIGKEAGEVAKDAPQATLKEMVWTANTPPPTENDYTGDMGVKMPVNAVKKEQDKGDQSGQDAGADVEGPPAASAPEPPASFLEVIKRTVRAAEDEVASLRSGPQTDPLAQHRGVLASS